MIQSQCKIDLEYFKENAHLKTRKEWGHFYNCGVETVSRWADRLKVTPKIPVRQPISDEAKKKISDKRKEWMKNNPERHPWRNKNRLKSEPCEKVKEFLKSLGVQFIEEFQPEIEDRFFSIDIALPDKMIALEINGNQHYERNGQLKPYYQERHDLMESVGWTVFEIHYSACFKIDQWANFVKQITEMPHKKEFDYFAYRPIEKKSSHDTCSCGCKKWKQSIRCESCFRKRKPYLIKEEIKKERRKRANPEFDNCHCGELKQFGSKECSSCFLGKWPTPEEMQKAVWETPTCKLRERFNASDVAIGKFCKRHGITKPPRGYWAKKAAGKLENT